jgi:flagellin
MATINTNMSANIASNAMTRNERSMSSTMERLSTGIRINSAKDDAAGLAISSKMTSQINGLNQAVRNANDAISMIQVAEGAMKEVTNMFQRMRELAVQAISDSNTTADRTALNNEYKQLSDEVKRVAGNTQWNGTNILDGARTSTTFQIGANASQTIAVNFGDLATNNIANASLVPGSTGTVAAATSGTVKARNDIAITGTVAAGDVITVKIDSGTSGAKYAAFTLTAEAATAINAPSALAADATGHVIESEVGSTAALATTDAGALVAEIDAAGHLAIVGTNGADGKDFTVTNVELSRGTHAPVGGSDITTSALANTALGVLDTAIEGVNSTRAGLGASMSRLEYASDNLQNVAQNTASARSRVMDADYAAETTELARTQIIQQASTAMLSPAKQSQQAVLALLK